MSNLQNRSSFQSVKGQDALLAYQPIQYQPDTYVERNGLIYKSLSATSTTFIPQQWELIADLREVRVPNIASRNALTGMTATTGTTGIRIPILDNTNVLVLDAFSDPQVAVHEFARYNYNQTTGTWLLLQKGTGMTTTNVSNYQLLTNKPPVISGVTVNVGNGLVGGGSVFGTNVSPFSAGGIITVSHADTSSQSNLNGSGYAYVQTLKVDTFGHVTGATLSTWIHPTGLTVNSTHTGYTYIQSIQVSNGHITGLGTSTWVHPATSFQGSSNNSGNVFIQSIQLDSNGHVTGISTGTASGGGGGSGSPLRYAGDFGGAQTMNSGGTLTFSGGTNIKTTRTGNPINAGLRIDFNAAGGTNEVQFNGGVAGALASTANVTITGGTTLVTNKLSISGVPVSGSTNDQLVTRNAVSGALQRLGVGTLLNVLTANNGINRIGNNFRLGGNLTGNTTIGGSSFDLFFTNRSITQNTRSLGTVGTGSASFGDGHIVSGLYAFAEGNINVASGIVAHAEGIKTTASGNYSHAQGNSVIASGFYSHAGGNGVSGGKEIIASGIAAFNHSQNDSTQNPGDGALADNSAILGGTDHNIAVGNQRAVIIGGNTIKLTGSSYVDHVAVANLAIFATPPNAATNDRMLTWNSGNRKVGLGTNVAFGSYSPAAVQISPKISTFTPAVCSYMQIGNVVNVSGSFFVNITTIGDTFITITPPIATTGVGNYSGNGSGAAGPFNSPLNMTAVQIYLFSGHNDVTFQWTSNVTGSVALTFSFTYRV